ncbi:MAG: hypothetical protein NW703_04515 [Nitrospiraceae bacterium]
MRAFIIRPFGLKETLAKEPIDFDVVERELIAPALSQCGVDGRTTLDILRQGNIRVDMFQRLLTADLVVADLSIHNANVFYELGIRHALRHKRTFLIRAEGDRYPFDLQTDRYFTYDVKAPAAKIDLLVAALRQTLESEAPDSPVFNLLPGLTEQDRSHFLPVPRDFREEVDRALAAKVPGDLELLASEVSGLEWEYEGLRVVGRAQFKLKAFEGARETWEAIRKIDPLDLEANVQLATVYQRLNDLARSDQAIQRALQSARLRGWDRAEIHALLGRNAKERWRSLWQSTPPDQRRAAALRSPFLRESLEAYSGAFHEDLNHFYSGLNALALSAILTGLATALPDVWAERFDRDDDARRALAEAEADRLALGHTVAFSLRAALPRLQREGNTEQLLWAKISQADHCFLTTTRPARAASAYQDALAGAPDFAVDAVRSQLTLYQDLGLFNDNVAKVLSMLPAAPPAHTVSRMSGGVLLFTGHRIDNPGRATPRFPADKESIARQRIHAIVTQERQRLGHVALGIAGGASGGDILFHEVCSELGIPSRLYLALPRDQFVVASVQSAGPEWVDRFNSLHDRLPVTVLAESRELPRWLRAREKYTIWNRNNLWMLYHALAIGAARVTLIALWNRARGDGPGGTEDMIQQAKARGAKTIIIDTNEAFGF